VVNNVNIPVINPNWETTLLVPVPAAEPVVSHYRAYLDDTARDGIPAHITVSYPFLPASEVNESLLASLSDLFSKIPAFKFTLDQVNWFGDEVVWLGLRDSVPFDGIIDAIFNAFPSCPEVIPHLTIGNTGTQQHLQSSC
jgi:hypothetical protein